MIAPPLPELPRQLPHDAIIDATLEGIITVDRAQRVVLFNPAAQQMFGVAPLQALGAELSRFIPARFRDAHRRHVDAFFDTPLTARPTPVHREVFGLRSDGSEFPLDASISHAAVTGADGRVQRFATVVLRDLSARRRMEDELRRVQERYRAIVEQSPYAICVIEGSRFALVNRACVDLFGADDPAQLLGSDAGSFLADALGVPFTDAGTPARTGETHPTSFRHIRRLDGGEREIEVSAASVPDHGNSAVQLMLRDVTSRRRTARLLRESREELRRLSGNLIEAREEERRRVSRELHDELGQRLSALKMQVSVLLAATGAAPLRARVAELTAMIDELVASVRRIAADLRPAMLDDLGLEAAIDWLATDSSSADMVVHARCDAACEAISGAAKTAVYRAVQEALINARRHARARRVDIEVRCDDTMLVVTVADDGQGMDLQAQGKPGSFGLVGMRERARHLGGTLDVVSSPGDGSRIEMRIPLDGQALAADAAVQGDL